jgi:2-C-methyl-D-erythritol 4-phosphate cytidylyltransferase / 2-C-methyl-D-erythritol 2,4-cyclodiphosphate synthase
VHVTAIIAAGGRGERFGNELPKQLVPLGGCPILQRSLDAFVLHERITDVIVALPSDLAVNAPPYLRGRPKPVEIVEGGTRRQDSVARAFARISPAAEIVVIHDAARPLVSSVLIERTLDAAAAHGAAVAALPATDTLKRADERRFVVDTLPRRDIYFAQTPQAFRVTVLKQALASAREADEATDEAALVERAGHRVHLVEGDPRNFKITTAEDLATAECLVRDLSQSRFPDGPTLRIGNGYDLHRMVAGRRLVLGGVAIPFEKGLAGHSDADALCHAVTDAILGAAAAGDIGRHFPDSDPAWKDADSILLLGRAAEIVAGYGYTVLNVDVIVIAEQPKVTPYAEAMRGNIARAIGIPPDRVSVKGKTNEGVGSIGAGESIAVHAVALITRT